MIESALQRSDDVLAEATDEYDLDHVFAMVSGGNDSHTALTVADESPHIELDGIIYIDTGIKVPETREFVKETAEKRGLDFHAIDNEYRLPQEQYENLVKVYGFPGPPVHNAFYYNLKGKPLQRFLRDIDGSIGLISGVLEDESQRRWENIGDDPIQEKDLGVWISPIYDWLEKTVDQYRERDSLRTNPVTEKLHTSGDCLCAAYGSREELRELYLFYPDAAEKIARLEREVVKRCEQGKIPKEYALWGHGNTDDREMNARRDTDQTMFNLCTDCEKRCSGEYDRSGDPETVAEAYLKSDDHSLGGIDPGYCTECDAIVDEPLAHREEFHPDAGASPKSLDIRTVPHRCGDIGDVRVTQGDISTTHPDGDLCENWKHDWEPYNGENNVAVRLCSDCGAFEVEANRDRLDESEWHLSAAPTPASAIEEVVADATKQVAITPDDPGQSHLGQY